MLTASGNCFACNAAKSRGTEREHFTVKRHGCHSFCKAVKRSDRSSHRFNNRAPAIVDWPGRAANFQKGLTAVEPVTSVDTRISRFSEAARAKLLHFGESVMRFHNGATGSADVASWSRRWKREGIPRWESLQILPVSPACNDSADGGSETNSYKDESR